MSQRFGPEAHQVFPWMLDGLDEAKTDHILEFVPEPLRGPSTATNGWLPTSSWTAGAPRPEAWKKFRSGA